MKTRVARWGNSLALRIPKGVLTDAGIRQDDEVSVFVNERGNIEMSGVEEAHRQGSPRNEVSFEALFAGYEGGRYTPDVAWPWPDDDFAGAEAEAWRS